MKIEKLTENKIRIILNMEDLEKNNIKFESLHTNTPEIQTMILSILDKAEKEIGFYTQDSKILIEAISSFDGTFVFIITKSYSNSQTSTIFSRKKPIAKRKTLKLDNNAIIYSFHNFDEFCNFCQALHIEFLTQESLKTVCQNTSLYFYNNNYYLLISGINTNYKHINIFFSVISEFTDRVDSCKNFDAKLIEHGTVIFKKNAISNTINIFVK